ncbi:MAG: NAD(P)H-dependent glycerol-3-phosphate dehydrogenase [Desulfobacterales bacterium]|nr:MAG: NAD(P)H-dependent glycerol-3-phosphate dehydrogenase [Desulfobacterales bacterium]
MTLLQEQFIAVIGAGSWGTALAKLLSDKGHRVHLWAHRPEHVDAINRERENKKYLPGFTLNERVIASSDLREVISGKNFILMVVPSHVYRSVFQQLAPFLGKESIVVSATKGIENDSLMTMSQVMEDELGKSGRKAEIGVLTGPSFAKEVAAGIPTAVTVAAKEKEVAARIQDIFFTERFRVYASTDLIGQELGAALKNIVAIAAGISDGLGYGTNTRAALITRGLAEITRLGVKMGANPLTFSGLGGLGDLVLTCTGDLSRNRTVGLKLGQGKKLQTILAEMEMVAEGVRTTRSAWNLARREGVDMPILEQIYKVLYEDKPCQQAVMSLLTRDQKEEMEY